MALTLTLREPPDLPLDFSGVLPERFAGQSLDSLRQCTVSQGRCRVALGQWCDVAGSTGDAGSDEHWTLVGDWSRVDGIAAGMSRGSIEVRGDVGHRAAAGMTGGALHVRGRAGQLLAAGLAGGAVVIDGDCGDHAASGGPGGERRMRGGVLVVRGSAGRYLAKGMRRGLVAVGGDCGDHLAADMLAGTVVVAGRCGAHPGRGLRRGTLVVPGVSGAELPGTFTRVGRFDGVAVRLVLRAAALHGVAVADTNWHLHHGDRLSGHRGEVWCAE